ncbi:YkyA family protein [Salicibibacter cibarius]|uniref:YkyA family protein n=1 Tax=Salicibibacter cibarius TaxID=2743000 RepID=A0A7T7CCA4_9BACI|nr:YkyA family protein [Salicibibacter cibarius]QQK76787.1 YkyA family protein [Salicibibacter cibarius]
MKTKVHTIVCGLGVSMLLALSACHAPEQSLQMHLEEAVELEEPFVEQQEAIVAAEEAEKERFEEMIELGLAEMDDIGTLANEATAYVDEREERMNTERKSLSRAYQEVEEGAVHVREIDDEEAREKAESVIGVMEQRYEAHSDLYEAYMEGLRLDRELYEMLVDEDLAFEDLEAHVDTINDTYETVDRHKETFNEQTVTFNDRKEEFYRFAGLGHD